MAHANTRFHAFRALTSMLVVVGMVNLAACGGGGSKDSGAVTQSSGAAADLVGRKSFTWDFEEAGDSAQAFYASEDGKGISAFKITACSPSASNCKVTRTVGKDGGKALQFWPKSIDSYAWIPAGSGATMCSPDYIQLDPLGNYDFRMTLAMWIKADIIESGATYHLFGAGDPVTDNQKYGSFNLRLVSGKVQLLIYPSTLSSSPSLRMTSLANVTPNVWHHVAVTYDNTATSLYVDGKLDQTGHTTDKRINEPCRPTYIGGMPITSNSEILSAEANSFIFPGAIDQLVFSNRTYTANEILSLAGGVSAK